ncbi:RNA polymerase sigma factor [Lutispora thermophila]|uniref:RNA polymerase sigma-70 factor, ECF subfamily n=1 Tax=Lutispora thermophila DSM 19022 TaxID=1122184 RepID=A0A1M6CZQ5_9FIRM|nr:RNA polymerase sigma factor [Lutispora thermophila]SHI66208.1 RNA polymerase sigma-70 factor, ECF subfamily [Lutispora thermophila DSM 19022]
MSISLEDQYDKIYRYCYSKVKNKDIAEDLTQETFLKYFNHTSYINRGKPLAYLYTIAKNLCIDFYRKSNREEDLKDELFGADDVSTFETNFAIKQAVSALPADLQEILLLRFANELGINEIANIMEISRFSVYRKLNKALDILKNILREEDFL